MVSSAQRVRLGLGAVCLVFCSTVGILATRAMERPGDLACMAPDFTLREVDGEAISLSSMRGQIVILIFCSAHEQESIQSSERIIRFANVYGIDPSIRVLSIDPIIPRNKQYILDELHVYKRVTNQSFPMLLDPEGKVSAQYDVKGLPTAVVIDAAGRIRYSGALDGKGDKGQDLCCEDALAIVRLGASGRVRAGDVPAQLVDEGHWAIHD